MCVAMRLTPAQAFSGLHLTKKTAVLPASKPLVAGLRTVIFKPEFGTSMMQSASDPAVLVHMALLCTLHRRAPGRSHPTQAWPDPWVEQTAYVRTVASQGWVAWII